MSATFKPQTTPRMDNIFSSSVPFLSLGELLGHFPFGFDGPARNRQIKFKSSGIFCTGLVVVVLIAFYFINHQSVITKSSLVADAWALITVMQFFSHLILWAYQIWKRKSTEDFLTQIFFIDNQVSPSELTKHSQTFDFPDEISRHFHELQTTSNDFVDCNHFDSCHSDATCLGYSGCVIHWRNS